MNKEKIIEIVALIIGVAALIGGVIGFIPKEEQKEVKVEDITIVEMSNFHEVGITVAPAPAEFVTEVATIVAEESTTETETTTEVETTRPEPTTYAAPATTEATTKASVSITGSEAADYIWNYMKSNTSWNDAVCAGIMGNIMREVGGDTLSGIRPTLYSSSGYYYGICQWNRGSFGHLHGSSLDYQLNYLCNTWVNSSDFAGIENTEEGAKRAAYIFADRYERCGEAPYNRRQSNAVIAYNYYV
jgi:hypothetical protein